MRRGPTDPRAAQRAERAAAPVRLGPDFGTEGPRRGRVPAVRSRPTGSPRGVLGCRLTWATGSGRGCAVSGGGGMEDGSAGHIPPGRRGAGDSGALAGTEPGGRFFALTRSWATGALVYLAAGFLSSRVLLEFICSSIDLHRERAAFTFRPAFRFRSAWSRRRGGGEGYAFRYRLADGLVFWLVGRVKRHRFPHDRLFTAGQFPLVLRALPLRCDWPHGRSACFDPSQCGSRPGYFASESHTRDFMNPAQLSVECSEPTTASPEPRYIHAKGSSS